ncbi:Dopey, N-terminal-domain-containing protein [Obelidium mucronatum]|nr:Dopey, N-terminal-domain-containing protein [Obelidium mucronatum]
MQTNDWQHLDSSDGPRAASPFARVSSPTPSDANSNAADFDALKKDPKYKRYVNAIDTILKLFDSVNEWADVIGFLSKLLKTLQMHNQYSNVPRKLVVSKRLAQCLNPALPSGVHQKTLEVYQSIFEAAGPAQLAEDLPLWSYGLFPFFQSAAMSVKPVVLNLYERHYLTLGLKLKPSLKGMILALLPGLEEEGNEFFDPVMQMLDKLCATVGSIYFFHCISLAIISGQRLRGAAVNYLLKRMPKFATKADVASILGGDTLVVSLALAAALEDKQLLVQRGALELLVVHFPLQNSLFPPQEVEVIVCAAIGVVLRKDMSLNRRLYSWLLGSHNDLQPSSRDSLVNTLRSMLWTSSVDIHELTKPYRIIISLLDKDEIGAAVLELILFDIFKSLKHKSETLSNYKELLQSAEMLLDVINSFIIWKHIYHSVVTNPLGSCQDMQTYEMLVYMLGVIRFDDEEVKRIHLPILLYWLSYHLKAFQSSEDFHINSQKLPLFLSICSKILEMIPPESIAKGFSLKSLSSLHHSERLAMEPVDDAQQMNFSDGEGIGIESFCSLLYGSLAYQDNQECSLAESNSLKSPYILEFIVGRPVVEMAFGNFQLFLRNMLEALIVGNNNNNNNNNNHDNSEGGGSVVSSESTNQLKWTVALLEVTCSIVERLACRSLENCAALRIRRPSPNALPQLEAFDHWEWLSLLSDCSTQSMHFSILNMGLSSVVNILHQAQQSSIPLKFDTNSFIQISVQKLWFYLDCGSFGIYHSRAVDLLWKICSVTKFGSYVVENVVANFLSCRDTTELVAHQQRFGIFWKLSEASKKRTGIAFSRPLFLVLDALRSQSPAVKRSGEAWIRNYVTSYSSVIDPILATLLHPDIIVFSDVIDVSQKKERIYFYKREFNMGQVLYSIETLCLLLTGHRSLLQTLWVHTLSDSHFAIEAQHLEWLDEEFGISRFELNYAELLIYVCLRFIRTEVHTSIATESKRDHLRTINISIQSQASEFLAKFLGLAETQNRLNTVIAKVLIRKITYSIAVSDLDLQPLLLLVLSAVYGNQEKLAVSQPNENRRNSTVGDALDNLIVSGREAFGLSPSASKLDEKIDSFETLSGFSEMILESLVQSSNRQVLQYWMDFIILVLPRINMSFRTILEPILGAICKQLALREREIGVYFQTWKENFLHSSADSAPDNDVVILVSLLDHIVTYCLLSESHWNKPALEKNKSASNLWDYNITGMVTSVFVDTTSGDATDHEPQSSRDAILELLPGPLRVLTSLYALFKVDPFKESLESPNVSGVSLTFLCTSVLGSIRHILDSVYTKYPAHLVESSLEVWFSTFEASEEGARRPDNSVLDMLHLVPHCTSQAVGVSVVEGLKSRLAIATNTGTSKDRSNPFAAKTKNISDSHLLFFLEKYVVSHMEPEPMYEVWPTLHSYAKDSLAQPTLLNANYFLPSLLRLVTVCIEKLIMTRHFEDKRMRFHMDEIYQKIFDLTIVYCSKPVEPPATALVQTPAIATTSYAFGLAKFPKPATSLISSDFLLHLSSAIIPSLRRLLLDQDKIIAILSNLVYYIVAPGLKASPNLIGSKFKPCLEILHAMSKLSFAVKTWKKETWDAFLDSRFFDMHLAPFKLWKSIMNSLTNADKDARIIEITGKISTASSSGLFVSRDQELTLRIYSVRRLSFLIWCGTVDQYLPQLPLIQEKLVEILKGASGPMHIEAYLCLRILMCRMTAHHLANLWPIVLTELIQLFGLYLRDQGTKEDLQVFLACCKLLELLLLLGTEEFQWHQWIFIRETLDSNVIDLPNPTSLVDKLSAKWGIGKNEMVSTSMLFMNEKLRRPILSMRTVLDKRQLAPFIATLSHHAYSCTLTGSKPDLAFIEELLEADIMELDSPNVTPPPVLRSLGSSFGSENI